MTPTRDPFELFMGAHEQIREALDTLQRLATISHGDTVSAQDRAAAQALVGFSERVIVPHHREEEHEFWPMVAHAEATAQERAVFTKLARRLQDDHQDLERRWAMVSGFMQELAAGRSARVDATELVELAQRYREHARLEDEVLVPLAQHLLRADDQNRLAVAVLLSRLPLAKWGMV